MRLCVVTELQIFLFVNQPTKAQSTFIKIKKRALKDKKNFNVTSFLVSKAT
jgi:hypothetical protein